MPKDGIRNPAHGITRDDPAATQPRADLLAEARAHLTADELALLDGLERTPDEAAAASEDTFAADAGDTQSDGEPGETRQANASEQTPPAENDEAGRPPDDAPQSDGHGTAFQGTQSISDYVSLILDGALGRPDHVQLRSLDENLLLDSQALSSPLDSAVGGPLSSLNDPSSTAFLDTGGGTTRLDPPALIDPGDQPRITRVDGSLSEYALSLVQNPDGSFSFTATSSDNGLTGGETVDLSGADIIKFNDLKLSPVLDANSWQVSETASITQLSAESVGIAYTGSFPKGEAVAVDLSVNFPDDPSGDILKEAFLADVREAIAAAPADAGIVLSGNVLIFSNPEYAALDIGTANLDAVLLTTTPTEVHIDEVRSFTTLDLSLAGDALSQSVDFSLPAPTTLKAGGPSFSIVGLFDRSGPDIDISQSMLLEVGKHILAAGAHWAQQVGGQGDISVAVLVEERDSNSLGSAFAGSRVTVGTLAGLDIEELGTLHEMRTGLDPNGNGVDLFVTVNAKELAEGTFYFDPDPFAASGTPPGNKQDLLTLMRHELGHGLGFSAEFSAPESELQDFDDKTIKTLDALIRLGFFKISDFVGENATAANGGIDIAFDEHSNSHLHSDILNGFLMTPDVAAGDRQDISPIEAGIIRDLLAFSIADLEIPRVDLNGSASGNNNEITIAPVFQPVAIAENPNIDADGSFLQRMLIDVKNGSGDDQLVINGKLPDTLKDIEVVNGPGPRLEIIFLDTIEVYEQILSLVHFQTSSREEGVREVEVKVMDAHGLVSSVSTTRIQVGKEVIDLNEIEVPEGGFWDTDDSHIIIGTPGDDHINGHGGNDVIFGGEGNDILEGAEGNDEIFGEGGNDTIDGGSGDDILEGQDGNDVMSGGDGNDGLRGGDGNDTLEGGDGNDFLNGEGGDDAVSGGAGNDQIEVNRDSGNDVVDGGSGVDSLRLEGTPDDWSVGTGSAGFARRVDAEGNVIQEITYRDFEFVEFGDGTVMELTPHTIDLTDDDDQFDDLVGTVIGHIIRGLWGDDDIQGSWGDDTIIGGPVNFDPLTGPLSDNDFINGGWGNDTIFGNFGADILLGAGDNDTIFGGDGNDILNGGEGDNRLEGGEGDDTFIFHGGHDKFDGGVGTDQIMLGSIKSARLVRHKDGPASDTEPFDFDIIIPNTPWILWFSSLNMEKIVFNEPDGSQRILNIAAFPNVIISGEGLGKVGTEYDFEELLAIQEGERPSTYNILSAPVISEGDTGSTFVTFTVERTGEGYFDLAEGSVSYSVHALENTASAASAGVDFKATQGTLTFDPGETRQTFTVEIIGDVVPEPDELFEITLSDARGEFGASIGDGTQTPSIEDDELAPTLDLDESAAGTGYTTTFDLQDLTPVHIADTDVVSTSDTGFMGSAEIRIKNVAFGDKLFIEGSFESNVTALEVFSNSITLSSIGDATADDFAQALRKIRFETISLDETPREIEITFTDNSGQTVTATTTVKINPADTLSPELDLNASESGSGHVAVFDIATGNQVRIADTNVDINDGNNTELQSATVTLVNGLSGDSIFIGGILPEGISVESADVTSQIVLTGTATLAAYESALETFRFDSTSTDLLERVIDVTVEDAAGNRGNVARSTINFVDNSSNQPPLLDLDADDSTATGTGATALFTLNGAAVAVADVDTVITDNDSATMHSATISITNDEVGDALLINGGTIALPDGISVTTQLSHHIVLSGLASAADYETAIELIRFKTTSEETTDRSISVSVRDVEGDYSNTATATIAVVPAPPPPPINSPPVLDLDANNSSAGGNDATDTWVVGSSSFGIGDIDTVITDADGDQMQQAVITLRNPEAGDTLFSTSALALYPGISVASESADRIVLTGLASAENYANAIETIKWDNTATDPVLGERFVDVQVIDAVGNASNQATWTVNVVAPPSPPGSELSISMVDPRNVDESSGETIIFEIHRAGAGVDFAETVNIGIHENTTAIEGTDYALSTQSLSFAAGETVKTFSATILDDAVADGDQKLRFEPVASNPNSIVVSPSTAGLLIRDDEIPLKQNSEELSGLFVEETQINDPVLSEGTSVTQFTLDTSPLSSLPDSETENPI